MRLGLAPINPTIGDLAANRERIERVLADARAAKLDLVVFPELCVSGYPPRDLLLRPAFVDACRETVEAIGTSATTGLTAIIGTPWPVPGDRGVANAALVYRDNQRVDVYEKRLLPTYDVFDEDRYFEPGNRAVTDTVADWPIGVAICEDLWQGVDAGVGERFEHAPDPIAELASRSKLIAVPSANPFVQGKAQRRLELLQAHAKRHGVYLASVNQVGANDDVIFDGHAVLIGPDGNILAAAEGFREELVIFDTDDAHAGVTDPIASASDEANLYNALVLGVRDYCHKSGFTRCLLGLSGGIDSALTAVIAARALGAENVMGVGMPGPYSSDGSIADARDLAERLGSPFVLAPIEDGHAGMKLIADRVFDELGERRLGATLPDVASENLQSRTRGALLMTISNRTGAILLTTGNKSELAVGYCTLYGDMNGGLAVLSDVPKTWVYRLSRWINEHPDAAGFANPPIPPSSIEKPPSAELAPGQLDSDSLPDYETLDAIIERAVEHHRSRAEIVQDLDVDRTIVDRVCDLIARNEYKRWQAAIGLKVRRVAFGPGRRAPLVAAVNPTGY
ncbi:MAG: NAD+ synthase [Phycisphaerae bacterium]|nr:NAD+ synthase [Phycisphaerae bacterium]